MQQNYIGQFRRQHADTFQHVVNMGLGNAGLAGETTLGEIAVPDATAKFIQKPGLESGEGERGDFHWK